MSSALDEAHSSWQHVPGGPRGGQRARRGSRADRARARRPPERDRRVGGLGPAGRPESQRDVLARAGRGRGVPHGRHRDTPRARSGGPATGAGRRPPRARGGEPHHLASRTSTRRSSASGRGSSCRCISPPRSCATTSARSRTSSPGAVPTAIEIRDGSSATITPDSLPEARTVLVLQPVNG